MSTNQREERLGSYFGRTGRARSGRFWGGRDGYPGIPAAVLWAGLLLVACCMPVVGAQELSASVASAIAETGAPGSGTLRLKTLTGQTLIDAPRLETDVEIRVTAMIARARVTQRFLNPGEGWAEGVYVFPLPEDGAVDRLRVRVGERVIEGEIRERGEARRIYDAARRSGRRAGLVDQERPNIFTTSVANIGPGEEVSVEIEYQQTVRFDQGRFHLRFPLVVGPRYIPGLPIPSDRIPGFEGSGWARDTDRVPDASRITPLVVDPAEGERNPVRIKVLLEPGFPVAGLESRFHRIDTERRGAQGYRVELAQASVPADRDFELVWEPAPGAAPTAALFKEHWQGADYGLLMVMPPAAEEAVRPAGGRELIFVVDTSGSMHGPSIDQAKLALKTALSRLTASDRFNLIQFNSTASTLFARAEPATTEPLRRALRYVDALRADGGTEMLPALRLALADSTGEGGVRQVVFLTDGSVGNEEALFAVIQQRLGSARLFTVGIGSAPNSHFMRRAAEHGRGTFTYIGRSDEVAEKMRGLFSKLEHVAMTDVRIVLPESGANMQIWPDRIPDLYLGEPLVVALGGAELKGTVQVRGQLGDRVWQQEIGLEGGASSPGVHGLWARRKISALMDEKTGGRPEPEARSAVLEVALAHRLVSRYTSLVAVDKTPVRPDGEALRTSPVPTNLPYGWSAEKVFGVIPQTAAGTRWLLLTGILSLLIGTGLWRWRRPTSA